MTLKPYIRNSFVLSIVLLSACTKETVVHETMADGNTEDPQLISNALTSSTEGTENMSTNTAAIEITNAVVESTTDAESGQVSQVPISGTPDNQTTSQNLSESNSDITLSDTEIDNEASTSISVETALNNPEIADQNEEVAAIEDLLTPTASNPSTDVDTIATSSENADPVTPISEESISVGTPGETVDCAQTLPCRWISADSQFEVTITSADNIGSQDRLTIEYAIQTSHDTELYIANTDPAVDSTGASFEPAALLLGERNGRVLLSVVAGTTTEARVEFDSSSEADVLSNWTIGLSDSGLIRQPAFTGIPLGDATDFQADCSGLLPCVWDSPDGNATVTLLSVNNSGSTNQLTVNFKIETLEDTTVAINSGAFAIDIEGLNYKGRTHGIGLENSGEELTATAFSGALVAGNIYFFRTQTVSSMLQLLSLVVYEDRPVPRWNPEFLSVPVQ